VDMRRGKDEDIGDGMMSKRIWDKKLKIVVVDGT
jgi:hypothetical protein